MDRQGFGHLTGPMTKIVFPNGSISRFCLIRVDDSEGVQHQEVIIPGHDTFSAGARSKRQELIVIRISTIVASSRRLRSRSSLLRAKCYVRPASVRLTKGPNMELRQSLGMPSQASRSTTSSLTAMAISPGLRSIRPRSRSPSLRRRYRAEVINGASSGLTASASAAARSAVGACVG